MSEGTTLGHSPAPSGSVIICKVEKRDSLNDWCVMLKWGGASRCFAVGETPLEAVLAAQDRSANLVRGLADMENNIRNGPLETI